MSLRSFFETRSSFSLKHPAVAAVSALKVVDRVPVVAPTIDLKAATSNPVTSLTNVGKLLINEVLAGNTKSGKDPQGEFEDSIELYNSSHSWIDLSGMYLTDSEKTPLKWRIPDGTMLNAGSYLVVWADEDGKATSGLHASFKLSSKGEVVYLVDTDSRGNAVIDQVQFGAQTNDVSFGRVPGKAIQWQPLLPTPNAMNKVCE